MILHKKSVLLCVSALNNRALHEDTVQTRAVVASLISPPLDCKRDWTSHKNPSLPSFFTTLATINFYFELIKILLLCSASNFWWHNEVVRIEKNATFQRPSDSDSILFSSLIRLLSILTEASFSPNNSTQGSLVVSYFSNVRKRIFLLARMGNMLP